MPSDRAWTRIALAVVGGLLALWGVSIAAVLSYSRRDSARAADAIVVLGAAQYDGRPSPVLRARLDHALALWRRGLAPRVILTGGTGRGDTTSEAAVGRRYMLRSGVPDSAILTENEGRTTNQSMRNVAALMRGRSVTRAIFVSDPFHMLRLAIVAREYGLAPTTSPTRTSPISANRNLRVAYIISESLKVPVTLAGAIW